MNLSPLDVQRPARVFASGAATRVLHMTLHTQNNVVLSRVAFRMNVYVACDNAMAWVAYEPKARQTH